ncbi:MAG: hypothetical protein WC273_11160 [Dehalococcoidia bacterium]
MPAEIHPDFAGRPTRGGAAVPVPPGALGRDLLRAFEAYFAAEQANLESLGRASEREPEFGGFYRDMLTEQRRSLSALAFQIASMLPDHPASRSHAIASIVTQNRAQRARALAASMGARPRTSGLLVAGAAAGIAAFALLGLRGPEITATSPIAPRVAVAAPIVFTSTPTPAPVPQPGVLEGSRVVAIYGHPYEPITGILGKYAPDQAAREVLRLAREAEAADGRPTVGALHLTVNVAQAQQTVDGTYLERLGDRGLEPWVEAARANGLLLILDTQIGWSDALTETKLLEPLLRLPFVHLALDPEFATKSQHLAPGKTIGTLDAASVNEVQEYLGGIVRRDGLPRKMLIVHQFRGDMITNADRFASDPDIEIVVDMDGFGSPGVKLDAYDQFALAPYSERAAIKLFFEWDTPMMTPHELAALPKPPAIVIYQ